MNDDTIQTQQLPVQPSDVISSGDLYGQIQAFPTDIKSLSGLFESVTTAPTLTPVTPYNQVKVYTNTVSAPTTVSLYVYSNKTNAWYAFPATGFAATSPACRVRASAVDGCATATLTKVSLDTVDFDTTSMFNLANHRIIITTAGRYMVGAQLLWAISADNTERLVMVYLNGSSIASQGTTGQPNRGDATISAILNLSANDYLELYARQGSGGALNTFANNATNGSPALWAIKI